jgi:hypothetical protein
MRAHHARWILPLLLVWSARSLARAGDISDEARVHFKAGVAFLQDPEGERFEDAYGEFRKAYALSRSPKVLGNIGLCAMKLERDGEAIDAYTRYLVEVTDIDPAEREQIARDLQTLKAGVVSATIDVTIAQSTVLDTRLPVVGSPVSNYYDAPKGTTVLRLRPGHHVVRLRVAGTELLPWEFTAEASMQLAHTFVAESRPAPEQPAPGGARVGPILLAGAGIATLAAGGVLGLATLGKVHTVDNECPQNVCPPSVASGDLSTAKDYVRATDFALLGGALLTAGGIVWYLLSGPHGAESPAAPHSSAMGACNATGCRANLEVRF